MLQENIITQKTKKKLYDPFYKDTEYFQVDEKLSLDIKSKISHWIPKRNTDVFEVRKILATEKDTKRLLNRSIGVYKVKNDIVISKNILETESKNYKKKINSDFSTFLVTEEKIKSKNFRNYISESRYNNYYNLPINDNVDKNYLSYNFSRTENSSTKMNLKKSREKLTIHDYKNQNKKENKEIKEDVIIIKETDEDIDKYITNTKENFEESVYSKIKARDSKQNILITSSNISVSKSNALLNGNKDHFSLEVFEKIKEEKEEYLNNQKKEDLKYSNTEAEKKNKTSSSTARQKKIPSSVRDFINKTKEIIQLRHSAEIKKETILKLQEKYENEFQSVSESIIAMKKAKDLFENEFFEKFEKYVKSLRIQKEREINDLNKLIDNKCNHEYDIQKLETKISKKKQIIELYREYRDFLICVKERKTYLPDFFIKNLNYKNNIPNLITKTKEIYFNDHQTIEFNNFNQSQIIQNNLANEKNIARSNLINLLHTQNNTENNKPFLSVGKILKKNTIISSNSETSKNIINNIAKSSFSEGINFSNIINADNNMVIDPILIDVDGKELEKYNNYITKPIYDSFEDLNDDIKKMQAENINLLKQLSQISAKSNRVKQELNNIKNEEMVQVDSLKNELNAHEKVLKVIIEKNKNLLAEKNSLINDRNNLNFNLISKSLDGVTLLKPVVNKSLVKGKYNQVMLYAKINEVFTTILQLDINTKIYKNSVNRNILIENSLVDKDSNMIYMLKIIENSIDFLIDKEEGYNNDQKKTDLFEKIKNELEKEKKIKKANDARMKEEKKREIVNQGIIERNNKVLVLPRRKFEERIKPKEQQVKLVKMTKEEEESKSLKELNL